MGERVKPRVPFGPLDEYARRHGAETNAEMARLFGVHERSVARWKRERTLPPSAVWEVAEFMGAGISDLIEGLEHSWEWQDLGACRGVDPDLFFPEKGAEATAARAKEVCAGCPVRAECLDHALMNPEVHGIWGGTSNKERKALRSLAHAGPHPSECRCRGCAMAGVS